MKYSLNPVHPHLKHPITREPLRALGVTKRGRIIWPQMGGDDTIDPAPAGGGQGGDGGKPGKTFSQADLDQIVADRLARERNKYVGYDDLKAKAARLDEIEAANKTELQRIAEERDAARVELSAIQARQVRLDAAVTAGLLPADAQFITAVDPDGARQQAEALAARVKTAVPPPRHDQGTRSPGSNSAPSVTAGMDLYAERRGKRTSTT